MRASTFHGSPSSPSPSSSTSSSSSSTNDPLLGPNASDLERQRAVKEILSQVDYYGVLGIDRTATTTQIRRAYFAKCKLVHPDKMGNSVEATRAFQKVASAYETLHDPARRKEYNVHGRRYHSTNSEETLSNALSQIFAEFMAGDFDNLMQIVEFINTQNPELGINQDGARRFFTQVREVVVLAGKYLSVAKFEVMRLYEIQQELRALSYFDVLGRLRLTIQMTRVFLSIPIKCNTHVTERQIMNDQFTHVLGGVAGFLEGSEERIGQIGGWVGNKRTSWWG